MAEQAEKTKRSGTGYRQISTELIAEIYAGQWPVGGQLPTESELVDRFGVSRNTVREALRELQDFGYLGKRRGTRSVVLRASPENSFVNSVRTVDELLEYARSAHNLLLASETIILTDAQAERLDCEPRTEWLRLQVLRMRDAGGQPFCYSEIYVAPDYAGVAAHFDPGRTVYTTIEARFGIRIARVMQTIEVETANTNLAQRLQVAPGTPTLVAKSYFYDEAGGLAEIGVGHFAMDRYRLRIALDRKRGVGDTFDEAVE